MDIDPLGRPARPSLSWRPPLRPTTVDAVAARSCTPFLSTIYVRSTSAHAASRDQPFSAMRSSKTSPIFVRHCGNVGGARKAPIPELMSLGTWIDITRPVADVVAETVEWRRLLKTCRTYTHPKKEFSCDEDRQLVVCTDSRPDRRHRARRDAATMIEVKLDVSSLKLDVHGRLVKAAVSFEAAYSPARLDDVAKPC